MFEGAGPSLPVNPSILGHRRDGTAPWEGTGWLVTSPGQETLEGKLQSGITVSFSGCLWITRKKERMQERGRGSGTERGARVPDSRSESVSAGYQGRRYTSKGGCLSVP